MCAKCETKYMRDFRTRNSDRPHNHLTGRICDNLECGGDLIDSIINFKEKLRNDSMDSGF